MDFKQIQELIKLVNDSNIGEVTVEQKDFKVTIKQKEEPVQHMVAAPMQMPQYTKCRRRSNSKPPYRNLHRLVHQRQMRTHLQPATPLP